MDYTVHGILQARILEWVAFPFSRDLPNPGIEPRSPTLQADSLPAELPGKQDQINSISSNKYSFKIKNKKIKCPFCVSKSFKTQSALLLYFLQV